LAIILQNFNLRFDDASYQLRIKTTLTIKPDGFFMRASLRDGIDAIKLEKKMFAGVEEGDSKSKKSKIVTTGEASKPMAILFGSNSGTCEGLAQSLASTAASHGYKASVGCLDSAMENLPTKQPVVIITASYEGNPPDNANAFVEWLKSAEKGGLQDAQYGVFGCGHHDWVATFQSVPKLIDDQLAAKGALRIVERGICDVAAGTVFDDFDNWQDTLLWPALSAGTQVFAADGLDMEISTSSRASHLRHNVQDAVVLKNHLLSAPGRPQKRHTEFKLPTSMTYEAGDYLAILPMNNIQTISRVLRRFGLPWDAVMTLKKGSHTTIPTDCELTVSAVLSLYVELNSPATRKNLTTLSTYASDELKYTISQLSGPSSVIDILEFQPKIALPFSVFLSMMTPMRIRQYSISSSPLNDPTVAAITYSVVEHDSAHLGVATNYLKALLPGSIAHVAVKKSHTSFHLPLDDKMPIIMVCAGTGLAPFRGFVQERAAKIQASGRNDFGEAVLFVGCPDPEKDNLYREEFAEWEKIGAVKVLYAFSQASHSSEGCKHIQDRVWHERELARSLFNKGAGAYICGSAVVGKGLADVVAKIVEEGAARSGKTTTYEEGLAWWEGLRGERYAVDVFD
jgi:cytochrome P450 / NADPH-cytochrome P450 reductase